MTAAAGKPPPQRPQWMTTPSRHLPVRGDNYRIQTDCGHAMRMERSIAGLCEHVQLSANMRACLALDKQGYDCNGARAKV